MLMRDKKIDEANEIKSKITAMNLEIEECEIQESELEKLLKKK